MLQSLGSCLPHKDELLLLTLHLGAAGQGCHAGFWLGEWVVPGWRDW